MSLGSVYGSATINDPHVKKTAHGTRLLGKNSRRRKALSKRTFCDSVDVVE